jgi:hypothetical protein
MLVSILIKKRNIDLALANKFELKAELYTEASF